MAYQGMLTDYKLVKKQSLLLVFSFFFRLPQKKNAIT